MPGQEKTLSTMTEPPTRLPVVMPRWGRSAARHSVALPRYHFGGTHARWPAAVCDEGRRPRTSIIAERV